MSSVASFPWYFLVRLFWVREAALFPQQPPALPLHPTPGLRFSCNVLPHTGFRRSLFLPVQSRSPRLPLWWELRQPRKGRSTASSLKCRHIKGWSLSSDGTCNHNFLCATVTICILQKSLPTELIFSIWEIWVAFYSLIIIYQRLSCSPLLAGCSKSTQSTREQWTEIFSRADGMYLQKPGMSQWNWDIWQP